MRIAVWKTNHPIADTVAQAVAESLNADIWPTSSADSPSFGTLLHNYDIHIGYGILRGADKVWHECERQGLPYFILDNGYSGAGHFDGNYRISLRGTQQCTGLANLALYGERSDPCMPLLPWRGLAPDKPVLVCPPTEAVENFFGMRPSLDLIYSWIEKHPLEKYIVRHKGDTTPLHFHDYNYVLTFNSSVGWQALADGVPCVSDVKRSIVGSYFASLANGSGSMEMPLDTLNVVQQNGRRELLGLMSQLQMTLGEMREGKLLPLIEKLLEQGKAP